MVGGAGGQGLGIEVTQIIRAHGVGGVKPSAVAHEQAPRPVGQEEALVGVERDGVRAFHAPEALAAALRERPDPPVGAVDVEPERLGRAEVRDRTEGIDGSGVGRARAPDDQERPPPLGTILVDRPSELVDPHKAILATRLSRLADPLIRWQAQRMEAAV